MILQSPPPYIAQDPVLISINQPAEEPKPEPKLYTIVLGDNLTRIAQAHNVPLERLWAANPQLTDPDQITPETDLKIPLEGDVLPDRPLPVNVEIAVTNGSTVKSSPRTGGFSSSGNTYTPGYCTWGVKNMRPGIPNGLGNANQWYSRASAMGMAVGSTPRVGAVAVGSNHVALVIGVNGSQITIKEMNYQRLYDVNTRTVSASQWKYIY